MEQILNNGDEEIVYFVEVDGKRFGPYPTEMIASMQSTLLPLTESEKRCITLVQETPNGKKVLTEG